MKYVIIQDQAGQGLESAFGLINALASTTIVILVQHFQLISAQDWHLTVKFENGM